MRKGIIKRFKTFILESCQVLEKLVKSSKVKEKNTDRERRREEKRRKRKRKEKISFSPFSI